MVASVRTMRVYPYDTLPSVIKRIRARYVYSQHDLAESLDVSKTYVSKLETGALGKVSHELIITMSEAFGIDYVQLSVIAGKLPENVARDLMQVLKSNTAFAIILERAANDSEFMLELIEKYAPHDDD